MQLTPRYGTDPAILVDSPPGEICEPVCRQRRRLLAAVAGFDDEQWRHPSRCEGWTNRDVVAHLDSTNTFWSFSIAAGVGGTPTEFLATFDPVATPAALVAETAGRSPGEVLESFAVSTAELTDLLESLGPDEWSVLAEAPPGHLTVSAVAHHALWDSWVHERDVLIPLGIDPVVEADEVAACLSYAAALSPALGISRGTVAAGRLAVDVTDPDVSLIVDIDSTVTVRAGVAEADAQLVLTGNAVELVDALSVRRPLAQRIPSDVAWMVDGLVETFAS